MAEPSTRTTGDLVSTIARYRHLVALAAAVLFFAVLTPAPEDQDTQFTTAGPGDTALAAGEGLTAGDGVGQATSGQAGGSRAGVGGAGSTINANGGGGALGSSTVVSGSGGGGAGGTASPNGSTTGATPNAQAAPGGDGSIKLVANCDPATGRIKVPTIYAPPCVPAYTGDNGGATAQGVTGDAIRIVFYRIPVSAGTEAALTAAGASNNWEDTLATFTAYVDYFSANYNLYGRKIELYTKEATGADDDDAAAQADAIDIAKRIKPFAVTAPGGGGTLNAFSQTLADHGIICICGVSQPQNFYQDRSPYLGYTTLMSSTQGYVHRSEYVCKRLGHAKAAHAGFRDTPADPMADEARSYAIVYYETEDKAYKAGVDYFEQLLAGCGIHLATRIEYVFDAATLQSQASSMISRMKSDGVTSVIFSGDPIAPAVFTQEATKQRWFPEWIVTGSALTDTNLFARTYDQAQWANAFGISYLEGLYAPTDSDAYKLHMWQFGTEPQADNTYPVIYSVAFPLFTGIHMAGPNLTPQTFQQGLFSYPPTGGGPTAPLVSYGDHGIWSAPDFTAYDDITEVWWDPNATGPDQLGNQGRGMYRYVANGKRYLPGQQPNGAPDVFNTENAPTFFDQRPASDTGPDYPPPSG